MDAQLAALELLTSIIQDASDAHINARVDKSITYGRIRLAETLVFVGVTTDETGTRYAVAQHPFTPQMVEYSTSDLSQVVKDLVAFMEMYGWQ